MDPKGRKKHEDEENYMKRSFIICMLHLSDKNMEDKMDRGCGTQARCDV